jgi:hypothetical protein
MPTKKTVTKKAAPRKTSKKVVAKKSVKKVLKKKAVKNAVVKKTATKRVTKKTVVKKTSKRSGKKSLVFASNETSFWVTDGSILNSLVALRDALDNMKNDVYSYHAGSAQNDFANWVSVVLVDEACAVDLEKAKNQKSATSIVIKHLKSYSS